MLENHFTSAFQQIEEFLATPGAGALGLMINGDLRDLVLRVLLRQQESPDFPHVYLAPEAAFSTGPVYARQTLEQLRAEMDELRTAFEEGGVEPETLLARAEREGDAVSALSLFISDLAEAMPDYVGSIVLLIDPDEVPDEEALADFLVNCTERLDSPWAKCLFLLEGEDTPRHGLDRSTPRIRYLDMRLDPARIRALLEAGLDDPFVLSEAQRARYSLLLSQFLRHEGESEHAGQILDLLIESYEKKDTDDVLHALARYDRGNLLLERQALPEAVEDYRRCLQIATHLDSAPIAAMAATNLGVALMRADEPAHAVASFDTARRIAEANGLQPLLVHVEERIADACAQQGDEAAAQRHRERARSLCEALDDTRFSAIKPYWLQGMDMPQGTARDAD